MTRRYLPQSFLPHPANTAFPPQGVSSKGGTQFGFMLYEDGGVMEFQDFGNMEYESTFIPVQMFYNNSEIVMEYNGTQVNMEYNEEIT